MDSIILFTFLTLNLDEQRKFVLKKLNEFGIVKSSLTETITQHVKLLAKSMRNESSDGLVHLEQIISVSTLRSIWNSVTSSKLDLDDPLFHHIYQGIDKIINSSRLASVFMVIWARHIINLDGVRDMKKCWIIMTWLGCEYTDLHQYRHLLRIKTLLAAPSHDLNEKTSKLRDWFLLDTDNVLAWLWCTLKCCLSEPTRKFNLSR